MKQSLASPPLIRVNQVDKDFELSNNRVINVLKGANFDVAEGSFTIIHGPSGSGKTTLLNVMTGLEAPTRGSVHYRNKNIYDLSENELAHFRAKTMGIVYQSNYWVGSLSVLENVALPLYFLGYDRSNAEREALESLHRVGMEKHQATLPSLLSGGEQQRVAMARALVCNPSYIVADEPTGNLDSNNGDDIIALLKYFNEKLDRTIILVTHNENYLQHGTQVLSMKDGILTETDTTNNVVDHSNSNPHQLSENGSLKIKSKIEKLKPIRARMLVHMAMANLKFKRFRSSLTILGVTIGIGSVFLLLSFGLGLQHLVQQQIIGTDSVKVINVTSTNSEILKMDDEAIKRFYTIANIEKIGKQNTTAGELKLNSAISDGVIYGVDKNYQDLSNLSIIAGRQLNTNNPYELLINKTLLKSLGYQDPSKAINKQVSISIKLEEENKKLQQEYKIVGVIDSGNGSAVYIPQATFTTAGIKQYKQVKIVARDKSDIPNIRQQLETYGFVTSSPLDTLNQVNRFFRFFNIILVGFGGIGMLIAVIGMLNTLTIALLERTKEIGLMIALGARRADMRRLFITESLLLSLIGGFIGILASILVGVGINVVAGYISSNRGVNESFSLFARPWWLILLTVGFMCIVGYVVSYIPARRAGRINPIDALRRE